MTVNTIILQSGNRVSRKVILCNFFGNAVWCCGLSEVYKNMKLLADNLNKIEMIMITLDGDSVIHNRRRIYSNGKGTFQDIYNRLIRIQEMGILFTVQINIDTENIENLYSLLNQMSKDLLGDCL